MARCDLVCDETHAYFYGFDFKVGSVVYLREYLCRDCEQAVGRQHGLVAEKWRNAAMLIKPEMFERLQMGAGCRDQYFVQPVYE